MRQNKTRPPTHTQTPTHTHTHSQPHNHMYTGAKGDAAEVEAQQLEETPIVELVMQDLRLYVKTRARDTTMDATLQVCLDCVRPSSPFPLP